MVRQPSFGMAEIAWRWSFGFAAAILFTFGSLEYLDSLPVSQGDLLFLRSRQPFLISQAIAHILRGSGPRLAEAFLVLTLSLTAAWIIIASLGRAATLPGLLAHIRCAFGKPPQSGEENPWRRRSLLALNFLRASAALAAAVGCLAAVLLAGSVSSDADPAPGTAFLVLLTVFMFVGAAWSCVNWVLSVAPIFIVREAEDTFGSISATVSFFRSRPGPVLAVSAWFGLAHLIVFFLATSVVAFPLALAEVVPGGIVFSGMVLVTLLYLAVVDFLYVGRLAALLAVLEMPEPDKTRQVAPHVPAVADLKPPPALQPLSDDDILCDIPGLIPPTPTEGC